MRQLRVVVAFVAVCALVACDKGKKAEPVVPDRWAQVIKAADELVPAAPSQDLTDAIALVTGDDVPEAAIDKLIDWAKAKGGLPWRGKHELGNSDKKATAFRIGQAALTRRKGSRESLEAGIYLAYRLREEGACLFDVMEGFILDSQSLDERLLNDLTSEPSPNEAELRRALAAEALCARNVIDSDWNSMLDEKKAAERGVLGESGAYRGVDWKRSDADDKARAIAALSEMALDAPSGDVSRLPAFVDATRAKYGDSWLVKMLFVDGKRLGPMVYVLTPTAPDTTAGSAKETPAP